jgi:putative endonuclease
MFFVYILKSIPTGQYYVGQTENPKSRLENHNRGFVKSTKSNAPYDMVFLLTFNSRSEAFTFEQTIKKQKSRAYIERLIASPQNCIQNLNLY